MTPTDRSKPVNELVEAAAEKQLNKRVARHSRVVFFSPPHALAHWITEEYAGSVPVAGQGSGALLQT
ncbi:hypothetical protein GCM10027073_28980 [Streptomyces chlorus]